MTKKQYIVNKGFIDDYGTVSHIEEIIKTPVGVVNSNKISSIYEGHERRDIVRSWKNIVIVIISAFLVLLGLYAELALIASIIPDAQLVFVTLTVMSAVELVCVVAPIFLIWMGGRNLFITSQCMITIYLASMFFPAYWSLLPGAIMLGLGWPLQWVALCSYLREQITRLNQIQHVNLEILLVRIFGASGLSIQCAIIFGNLISFFTLNGGDTHMNGTITNEALAVCGKNYCNEDLHEDIQLKIPDKWRIDTLYAVLTACGVMGCILPLFADNKTLNDEGEEKEIYKSEKSFWESCEEGIRPFFEAMKMWKDPKQLLLFPYFLYLGFEIPYYLSDYTKAFVSCALGIPYIGAILACFGVADMVFCIIQSHLVSWFGRKSVILFGGLVHLIGLIISLTWQPTKDTVYLYYILAIALGIGDAVAFTQGFAFTSVLFEEKSDLVYSNCIFVCNVSFLIAYIYSLFICITAKIYVIMISLILGIICLFSLEIFWKPSKIT